jgi:hypothetical protein
MSVVCLADPDLGFFLAQQMCSDRKAGKESMLGLIQVVSSSLTAVMLYGGFIQQFQCNYTWKVLEKGYDFVV